MLSTCTAYEPQGTGRDEDFPVNLRVVKDIGESVGQTEIFAKRQDQNCIRFLSCTSTKIPSDRLTKQAVV
ncbi:MAG: hypothetical protein JWM56_1213 [Candidatus Peribacteria bacterium]|nr:hypothetical protein [Candidatus Peribacteria bacterium]